MIKLRTLLALLLGSYFRLGVVAEGGGGAVVEDDVDDGDAADDADNGSDDADGDDAGSADDAGGDADGEITISLGGEESSDEDSDDADAEEAVETALPDDNSRAAWARLRKSKDDFRKGFKDLKRREQESTQRIRELEEQIQSLRPAEATIEVGAEPVIDGYVDEYDTLTPEKRAQFKADHAAWVQRKADADKQKATRDAAAQQQQQQWQARLQSVDDATASMKVAGDKQAAVKAFDSTFSVVQRGIIMGALDQPETSALMRHALGSNTTAARKLAAINDPVKFAVAVGELKMQMKVTKGKKVAPAPDKRVISGKPSAAATSDQLERLRAEADKTGDRSKVVKYMREQNRRAA